MKTKLLKIVLMASIGLVGCARDSIVESVPRPASPPKQVTIDEDFIMGSTTAVSNAMLHNGPPEGWDIVCDNFGNYSPRNGTSVIGHYDDMKLGNHNETIRTSRWEAVVASWRLKEIWDAPKPEFSGFNTTNQWHVCDP